MTRTAITALVLALVALGAVGGGVGVAAAQESGNDGPPVEQGDQTATEAPPEPSTETATENGSEDDADREVAARVDDRGVFVERYWYNATTETFYLRISNSGELTSTVTITEAISRESEGARRFGIAVVDVAPGETVQASLSARRVDGAAGVMVLTQRAIETGSGLYLQESRKSGLRLIGGGASGGHVRAAGLGAGGGALLLVLAGAWQYVASRNDEVKDANLEPKTTLLGRMKDE